MAAGDEGDEQMGVLQVGMNEMVQPPGAAAGRSLSALLDALGDHDEDANVLVDRLTGLPNRRQLEVALEARLDNLRRYGWAFGMLLVDVDDFMAINDRYGHDAGDRALCDVATTVLRGVRPGDFASRWGGDEFVLLVNGVDRMGLEAAGERVRALVSDSIVRAVDVELEVRVSVGGTLADPQDGWHDVFARADAALYRAKREGRDRVSVMERR